MANDPLLKVEDLHVYYGASHVLHGVTLEAGTEPLSIVGRNGMGKSTLCQAIMGLVPSARGTVHLGGERISGRRAYKVARAGVGYVPQGRRVFPSLTVDEHLRLVGKPDGEWTVERIYETFPRLAERRKNGGGALSGGEQQMLAISRALLLNPRLLVMDEPTEGLAPVIVDHVVEVLREIGRSGVGLLLVEQNLTVATEVSERIMVMMNGGIALETNADALLNDRALRNRYLGVSAEA
ncbi:amino acid/amide ABC transporter ATP-binding protein 2, HAAT family [Palleronia marisminoris]|uniref:High-affinity branched-chain amino acid transport ATP-binding protein LivF n=1 Tax=Palleronia marisminoris TaxID=315423 RepID=A0A1Y5TT47_9RHOB|nr:ABC transporter ATP-binding protein [Palleronia marisminoris]SFH51334.1 amino acid/amide ABC transporter ATP-binding protein 2, HAAT family [Palleronia marisminoris]SLN70886.1 High-affinity branched-chain amino acid transport ATP-binding protein LivF [Palleronia marisminoris]